MADFQITLVTPEKQVLDEAASYVSMPAWDGQIGIAPQRAPIVVKLGDGSLRITQAGGSESTYFVAGGFAQMKDNRLTVLTEEAISSGDVDKPAAQSDLDDALKSTPLTDDEVAERDRKMNRAKTILAMP